VIGGKSYNRMNLTYFISIKNLSLFLVLTLVLCGFAFSGTDSTVISKGVRPATSVLNKDSIAKRDSLSIDSLLKNMELKKEPVSLLNRKVDNDVRSSKSSKSLPQKEQLSKIDAKLKSDALYKKIYDLMPGVAFLRIHFVHILLLLFLIVLVLIVFACVQRRNDRNHFLTSSRLSIMDKEVQRACLFVENNLSNPDLSVELICSDLITGEAFLGALFVKELGISLDDFIKQVRINRVKNLLNKEDSFSIEKLFANAGFTDEKSMRDVFLEITGVEFDAYRNSLLQEK
jgi:AraC-like DNA-binding protein